MQQLDKVSVTSLRFLVIGKRTCSRVAIYVGFCTAVGLYTHASGRHLWLLYHVLRYEILKCNDNLKQFLT